MKFIAICFYLISWMYGAYISSKIFLLNKTEYMNEWSNKNIVITDDVLRDSTAMTRSKNLLSRGAEAGECWVSKHLRKPQGIRTGIAGGPIDNLLKTLAYRYSVLPAENKRDFLNPITSVSKEPTPDIIVKHDRMSFVFFFFFSCNKCVFYHIFSSALFWKSWRAE